MATTLIQIKRDVIANIGTLSAGELYLATDTFDLYIGSADGNKLVGGIAALGTKVSKAGDTMTGGLTIQRTSNDVNPPTFIGTKIRIGGVLLNDNIFQLSGYGADNTLVSRHGAYIAMSANGTWSTTSSPAIITLATTPVNTISPVVGLTLTAAGQVQINGHTNVLQLRVIGNSTQTTNIQEWQNSSGTVLASVNPYGGILADVSSPSTAYTTALIGEITPTSANGRNCTGVVGYVLMNGSFTQPSANEAPKCFAGNIDLTASSLTVNNVYGFRFGGSVRNNSILTNYYGYQFSELTLLTGGAVTNQYGVYVNSLTNATNNYAIYTNTGKVVLGDTTTTKGRKKAVVTKTADYTVTTNDECIVCNSATPITITLPAATGTGQWFAISNVNTGVVTLEASGSETINGDLTQLIDQWATIQVIDYATGVWTIL